MRYLLDTNILISLMRPNTPHRLVRRMALTSMRERATSTVVLGELIVGAYRSRQQPEVLLEAITRLVPSDMRVLPYDVEAAEKYGWLSAHLASNGMTIGHADTQIASTALVHDLIVVTANVKHFIRVPGLTVENWLE